jgi:hypothetical protein
MGRTLFALLHLGLFAGLAVYGVVLLVQGQSNQGFTILGIMGLYYALVLHKAVLAEIERKRRLKKYGNVTGLK